jgi:hypothetical protein
LALNVKFYLILVETIHLINFAECIYMRSTIFWDIMPCSLKQIALQEELEWVEEKRILNNELERT